MNNTVRPKRTTIKSSYRTYGHPEEWRPFAGKWAGHSYEVSNWGRVRSGRQSGRCAGRLLSVCDCEGYQLVKFSKDAKQSTATVHSLVAEAFIGPRPEGMTINHKDGDKKNNRPENLEYLSQAENIWHARRTGLLATGERSPKAILTWEKVRELRRMRAETGWSVRRLGPLFGVDHRTVCAVLSNQTWVED